MPREIETHTVNGCNDALELTAQDEPGSGGANHHYQVRFPHSTPGIFEVVNLRFQNGPIKEVGTNGITHEVLLAVLIDRLEGFQRGPFACTENRVALTHLRDAAAALRVRTMNRVACGVEGTHKGISDGLTTNREDPRLSDIKPNGQQAAYLVLSDEERAKGFVRPVRQSYKHTACGTVTTMGRTIAETYARDPKFYGGTFCCGCGKHFPLKHPDGSPAFVWATDDSPVGS